MSFKRYKRKDSLPLNPLTYSDLKEGDLFRWADTSDHIILMKTDNEGYVTIRNSDSDKGGAYFCSSQASRKIIRIEANLEHWDVV